MNIALASQVKKKEALYALYGSVFVALCSLIAIPVKPISITMQVLALFILALTQSPKVCFAALAFYLVEATLGLPVLCGHSNPLWFMEPSAGYLIAFPFAGYVIAKCIEKRSTVVRQFLGMVSGLSLIYLVGGLWLANFIGFSSAFALGVLFFIPFDLIKMGLAIEIVKYMKRSKA